MASPRSLPDYPAEFHAVLRRAIKEPRGVSIPLASREEAIRLRGQIYSYRKALEFAEGTVWGYEDLMLMAPLARMRIEGTTLIIYFEDIDYGREPNHSSSSSITLSETADSST